MDGTDESIRFRMERTNENKGPIHLSDECLSVLNRYSNLEEIFKFHDNNRIEMALHSQYLWLNKRFRKWKEENIKKVVGIFIIIKIGTKKEYISNPLLYEIGSKHDGNQD